MSSDFLDVANFPKITFESRRIEGTRERFRVIGDVTIRGKMMLEAQAVEQA